MWCMLCMLCMVWYGMLFQARVATVVAPRQRMQHKGKTPQPHVLFDPILQRDVIQGSQRLIVARLLEQRVQQRDFSRFGRRVHDDLDANERFSFPRVYVCQIGETIARAPQMTCLCATTAMKRCSTTRYRRIREFKDRCV